MTCDIHTWRPVLGECAVYACECGATGYRARSGIRAHRKRRVLGEQVTARSRFNGGHSEGRVSMLPRLDQTEKNQ